MLLCTSGEVGSTPASQPQQHIIEIRAFSFQPSHTVVAPGDTIVWINRDIVPHTVTADGGSWKSRRLEEGDVWKMVVENDRGYTYHCAFHPQMKGALGGKLYLNFHKRTYD